MHKLDNKEKKNEYQEYINEKLKNTEKEARRE
jgi:hypothetical protein